MNMIACNTTFKEIESRLVTYKTGDSSSQIDNVLVRRTDRGLVTDGKVIASEPCVQQHKLLMCDLALRRREVKERIYMSRRKI